MNTEVSDYGQVLGEWVKQLTPAEALVVAACIADSVKSKLPVEYRLKLLALLIRLIDDKGRFPSADEYDEARDHEAAEGRDFPSRRLVAEEYGGYRAAVAAAYDLYTYGQRRGTRKPSRKGKPRGTRRKYSPDEIVRALVYFRVHFGAFPRSIEWVQWQYLEIRSARERGAVKPALPTLGDMSVAGLQFPAALALAKEQFARGAVAPVVEGMPSLALRG
jgi:hypothetical protein